LGDLLAAIRAVAAGQAFFSPAAAACLLPVGPRGPVGDVERLALLSPRERQVLELVALGLTSVEVGERLAIAQKTVEAHRSNLSAKLGLRDLPALVRFAVRTGVIALDA
jgi:two-component system NarL family response regulator